MYRETCRCGHDKASHFREHGVYLTCLATHCQCRRYRNENERPTLPAPKGES